MLKVFLVGISFCLFSYYELPAQESYAKLRGKNNFRIALNEIGNEDFKNAMISLKAARKWFRKGDNCQDELLCVNAEMAYVYAHQGKRLRGYLLNRKCERMLTKHEINNEHAWAMFVANTYFWLNFYKRGEALMKKQEILLKQSLKM